MHLEDLSCIKLVSLTSWRPLVINNRHSSLACGFISFTLTQCDLGLWIHLLHTHTTTLACGFISSTLTQHDLLTICCTFGCT
ncbi:unnamed protein product [Gadus morhua 'NCC']